jgi:hypothetical protein
MEILGVHSQKLGNTRLKPNKEVHHDGIYGDRCKSDWDIDEGDGGSFYGWMVHRSFLMTKDHGTVSEQCGDFGQ